MLSEPRLSLLYRRRSQSSEVLVFTCDWLISIGRKFFGSTASCIPLSELRLNHLRFFRISVIVGNTLVSFPFRVIYSGGDKLPERVDVEFKSIFNNVKPTVLKNIGPENSSYSLIGTGE